jgi:hypothetical protein
MSKAFSFSGTYVLTSDQVILNGTKMREGETPTVGQIFCWAGDAMRLDGPQSTLLLEGATKLGDLHRRASKLIARKFDLAPAPLEPLDQIDAVDSDDGFEISDGLTQFTLVPIRAPRAGQTLLWCPAGIPETGRIYHVTRVSKPEPKLRAQNDFGGDVICFTQGTRIRTEDGEKLVEHLSPGDYVQTKDDGMQEILWTGQRRMSGARLHAMPELRPVRIRYNALGYDIPDSDLLVSPHHRIIFSGAKAQALFNQSEVLVAAHDLINDSSVFVDHAVQEVTYHHILLANHQVLWANGVATESYHPASTSLETIEDNQRGALLELFPDLAHDLHSYGGYARRNLDRAEAAILIQAGT